MESIKFDVQLFLQCHFLNAQLKLFKYEFNRHGERDPVVRVDPVMEFQLEYKLLKIIEIKQVYSIISIFMYYFNLKIYNVT